MSDRTVLRKAEARDVPAIRALLAQLADATRLQHKLRCTEEALLRHGFSGAPSFEVVLAENESGVVGMTLYLYVFSSWRGEIGLYVQDIVVARGSRGQGLGRLLLAETARVGRERGATHLRLSVERDNDAAKRFYELLGLDEADTECLFEADGDAFDRLAERT